MIGNEKAEFAVKILLEYADENGINGRDTTDLSPLEKWLILRLYSVTERIDIDNEQQQKMYDILKMYYHRSQNNGLLEITPYERNNIKKILRLPNDYK